MASPLVFGMGMLPLAVLILKGRSFHQQPKSLIMETKKAESIWNLHQWNLKHSARECKTQNSKHSSSSSTLLPIDQSSQSIFRKLIFPWAGEINSSVSYFFDAVLLSLKDCKKSLISRDKLGIKPLFNYIKTENSSHLLSPMMWVLPHCLLQGAVASQVLSSDTLNQPKSPQKGLAAHPRTVAWQLQTLPAHWAETPAVSALSAQNTPPQTHPK